MKIIKDLHTGLSDGGAPQLRFPSFQVTNSQELLSAEVPWFPALPSTDPTGG